jgi:Tfp pilus assembly protein PilN
MIKVNLVGKSRKSRGPSVMSKFNAPPSLIRIVLILIFIASGVGGYLWWQQVTGKLEEMNTRIAQAQTQKAQLEKVIKEDQKFASRKKEIENRIKIIEGLKKDQISPIVSLDALARAIDRTNYVWLGNLDQNNAVFSMSGTGTSVNAIADFVSNLESTGYFHNINLVNAQDARGNFTFSMTTEFAPPVHPSQQLATETQTLGAN